MNTIKATKKETEYCLTNPNGEKIFITKNHETGKLDIVNHEGKNFTFLGSDTSRAYRIAELIREGISFVEQDNPPSC